MQYRVALDPQLELSAAEFVAAWNRRHADKGGAAVDASAPESFLSQEVMMVLIAAAVSIPTSVVADFVSEYLKKKFIDKDTPKVTVTTISTSDGQPVWVVKTEEK